MSETITWVNADDSLPDSDIDVLIFSNNPTCPVWIGHHDGEKWRWSDSMAARPFVVSHWAEIPGGPGE